MPQKKSKKKKGAKESKKSKGSGTSTPANGSGAFIEEVEDSGDSRPQSRSATVEKAKDD